MAERLIIIGAGHAGTNVAESPRRGGWSGEILMLTEEETNPYDRPPLSKGFLTNGKTAEDILLNPVGFYEANEIDYRSGLGVTTIDPEQKTIHTTDSQTFSYDYLVIATGSGANVPDLPGSSLEGVHSLRTLREAQDLKEQLSTTKKIVIIGGGLIGMEVASATQMMNIPTTVVHRSGSLLSRLMSEKVSSKILSLHRRHGTEVLLNTKVAEINGSSAVESVTLETGEIIKADTVLVAAGGFPETSIAQDAGLTVDNGIVVNPHLQTSDTYIYAAGDVARYPTTMGSERLESWKNALDQGVIVADNIMGKQSSYDAVPWMWSDQFEKVLQVAGRHDPRHHEIIRELEGGGIMTFHLSDDGVLRAATAFGDLSQVSKSIRASTAMIEKGLSPDAALLADGTNDLRKMLKSLVSMDKTKETTMAGQ